MDIDVRRGVVAVLLIVSAACGGSAATVPTGMTPVPAAPSPAPVTFPPLTGPSRTFVFKRERLYAVSDYTRQTRFVLYDNGAFALHYDRTGFHYHGGYTETEGVAAFDWGGVSGPYGKWEAIGRLQEDWLTVEYNELMQNTDFEDAVYVRAP